MLDVGGGGRACEERRCRREGRPDGRREEIGVVDGVRKAVKRERKDVNAVRTRGTRGKEGEEGEVDGRLEIRR